MCDLRVLEEQVNALFSEEKGSIRGLGAFDSYLDQMRRTKSCSRKWACLRRLLSHSIQKGDDCICS